MFSSKKLASLAIASFAVFAMSCGDDSSSGGPSGPDYKLVVTKKGDGLTLSSLGDSYADIDGTPDSFKQTVAEGARIKDVDVGAYAGTEDAVISSAMDLDALYDYTKPVGEQYLGSPVLMWKLSADEVTAVKEKNGEGLAGIFETVAEELDDDFDEDATDIDQLSIAVNNGALVFTTEGLFRAIVITADETKSVDFDVYDLSVEEVK